MDELTRPLGMATANYWADDVVAARDWYSEVLGLEPYFAMPEGSETPSYVEFRVGSDGDEFGIVDRSFGGPPAGAPAGILLYWHVADVAASYDRLLALGAVEYQPVMDRGHDFVTAAVIDPFGNVLGVMQNPHFAEVHAEHRPN